MGKYLKWSNHGRVSLRPHRCMHCGKYSSRPPYWLAALFAMTGTHGDPSTGHWMVSELAGMLGLTESGVIVRMRAMQTLKLVCADRKRVEKPVVVTGAGLAGLQKYSHRWVGTAPRGTQRALRVVRFIRNNPRRRATQSSFALLSGVTRERGRQIFGDAEAMGWVRIECMPVRYSVTPYGKVLRHFWRSAGFAPLKAAVVDDAPTLDQERWP